MHGTRPQAPPASGPSRPGARHLGLERRLGRALEGEVRFDAFTRGRYATDASIYQITPLGVAFPKTPADVEAALKIAREEGVPVIARRSARGSCSTSAGT